MTTIPRGAPATLLAEWRLYEGGPFSTVTGVTIGITRLDTAAVVLATTAVGVMYPSPGINTYVWTSPVDLPVGQYLATWTATDLDSETVGAVEVLDVTAGGQVGGPYADRSTLKRRMGIPDSDTSSDADADSALASASDAINRWTGRQFGRLDEASPRTYYAGPSGVTTDDFWTADGLDVDGTPYASEVAAYALEPLNGIRDGVPGWPFNRITRPYGGHPIYQSVRWSPAVTVTACWGWAEVPASVRESCLLLAADDLKSKDAPFGVAGFGDYAIRVRANPKVQEKLAPYVREPVKVAS